MNSRASNAYKLQPSYLSPCMSFYTNSIIACYENDWNPFCSTRSTQELYTNRLYPVHLRMPPRVLDPALKILERRCNASQARKVQQRQVRAYTIPGVQNTNSGHNPCMTEIAATFCSSYVHTWRQGNDRKKVLSFIFFM
jgi:hypothetical protein